MERTESDARWRALVAVQDEVQAPPVLLPTELRSRADGRPREAAPRTVRFAKALAFDDGWSGIDQARRRMAA